MSIKRGKLEFQNVLSINVRCTMYNYMGKVELFKKFIEDNNLLITGPFILKWNRETEEDVESLVKIMIPIHQRVNLEGKSLDVYGFEDNFIQQDGLKIRSADVNDMDEVSVSEKMLELVADKMEVELLKPYYYIYLPVYGDYVVDIYAPIK